MDVKWRNVIKRWHKLSGYVISNVRKRALGNVAKRRGEMGAGMTVLLKGMEIATTTENI